MKFQIIAVLLLAVVVVLEVTTAKPAKKENKSMTRKQFNARLRRLMKEGRGQNTAKTRNNEPRNDEVPKPKKNDEVTREQTQSEFGEEGTLQLRSQSQKQSGRSGASQTQTQSQMMLSAQARAEFQSQAQRVPGLGRQTQSQSQYNLGDENGKKYESTSKNQMANGVFQNQNQRQTFNTTLHDEQSQSISEGNGGYQAQGQVKGAKIEEIPLPNFDLMGGMIVEGGVLVQFQRQWQGGSYSYTKLIPFADLDFSRK